MNHGLGLIWDPALEARQKPLVDAMIAPPCSVSADEMPQRIDLRDIIPTNDQGPFNSCDGNSVDFALQADVYASTGKVVNTSARFAYLAAKRMDDKSYGRSLDPRDAGATISGGILAAKEFGSVLEADFPYWKFDWQTGQAERFSIDIPDAVLAKALDHRVRTVTPVLWSWAEMLPLVATRQAMFSIGIWWNGNWANPGTQPITRYPGGGSGGHALAVCEYEWINGERWPRIRNSHGKRYADKGTVVVRPDVFDYALRQAPWGARGLAGTQGFVKRKLDLFQRLA